MRLKHTKSNLRPSKPQSLGSLKSFPSEYGIKIRDDSMIHRYERGGMVIASPTERVVNSNDVVVKTKRGEVMARRIRFEGNTVILESVNPAYKPIPLRKDEIDFCHKITWYRMPD